MSTVKFAEEFTHLISRWTGSPVLNTDGAANLAPLSKQQVINTIKSVVGVMLGVTLHEAPKAGIAASRLSERLGSLDSLQPSFDNVNSFDLLSSKSQDEMEIAKCNTFELLPADKKFMSRSNPSICVSFTDRPGAANREQAEKGALHNATEQQEHKVKSDFFLNKIEVLRKSAADVVAKIDELRKEMSPQTVKPFRRLPPIAASPVLTGSSSLLRKVPLPNPRRSSSGFTGTSTTKKLNTTITLEKEKASVRRQTIAPGSIYIKPAKISLRSRSPSVAGSTTKKSPPSTFRAAKNPKYAHIRSTIPKVASTKKA